MLYAALSYFSFGVELTTAQKQIFPKDFKGILISLNLQNVICSFPERLPKAKVLASQFSSCPRFPL
jgi:hypothetical protein